MAQWLSVRLEIDGSLVPDSSETQHCVLEQALSFCLEYWLNSGTLKHQSNKTIKSFSSGASYIYVLEKSKGHNL